MRHDMAPVAGRVTDGQQHGDIPLARFVECFVAPLPPVHRVVSVLQQIRARRTPQPISHASILAQADRPKLSGPTEPAQPSRPLEPANPAGQTPPAPSPAAPSLAALSLAALSLAALSLAA